MSYSSILLTNNRCYKCIIINYYMKTIYIDLNQPQQHRNTTNNTPIANVKAKTATNNKQPIFNHTFAKFIIDTDHLLNNTRTTNNQHIPNPKTTHTTLLQHINQHQTVNVMNLINDRKERTTKTAQDDHNQTLQKETHCTYSKDSYQYIDYLKEYNSVIKTYSTKKCVSPLHQKEEMDSLIKEFLEDIEQKPTATSRNSQDISKQSLNKPNHTSINQMQPIQQQPSIQYSNITLHPAKPQSTTEIKQKSNKSNSYKQNYERNLNKGRGQVKEDLSLEKQEKSINQGKYIQSYLKKKQGKPKLEVEVKRPEKMVEVKQVPKKSIEITIDLSESYISANSSNRKEVVRFDEEQTQKEQLIRDIKCKVKELLNKQAVIVKR